MKMKMENSQQSRSLFTHRPFFFFRLLLGALLVPIFIWGAMVAFSEFFSEVEMSFAYNLLNTKDFLKAGPYTDLGVRLNPQNGYARYYRAAYLKKTGNLKEALPEFQRALRTTAHPASVLRLMAEAELDTGDYVSSCEHYRLALQYDPAPRLNPAQVYLDFGHAAQFAGHLGDAMSAFRMSGQFPAPSQSLGPAAGFLMCWLGAVDAGIEEYVFALKQYPALREKFPDWAYAITKVGRYNLGVSLFSRLDAMGLLDARGLCLLASFYLYMDDLARAGEILKRAESINAAEPNIYLLRGEIHYKKGEKEPMRQMYSRFLKMMPDAPQKRDLEKRMME
jgi:tetratricopeptide (TPR) repeat protein